MPLKFVSEAHGKFSFDFPRISVILGANGSGKSTLLREIKDTTASVYVEGGRTITIQDTIRLTRQNFSNYRNLKQTEHGYKEKRKQKLVDRIFDAIMVLIQREQFIKDAHSDEVTKWIEGGQIGPAPKRRQPPLERVFGQYNEIFPHLKLSYDQESGRVNVRNDDSNSTYGPSRLSDGEKQVFSLLADLLQVEDEYDIVVVDEPELNLHPELAERLWSLLESEYQQKNFLYATHSIQFALRSNVEALYVLATDPKKIRRISRASEIARIDLEKFLGGVPGILNSSNVIVCEGHEKSFDSIFYRWILNDDKVEIFPCGNCHDVNQVIRKSGLWSEISTDISLCGAIDSDYRSASQLTRLETDQLKVLPLHEAESFLCLPEVLVDAAKAIGSQESIPTVVDVEEIIFQYLDEQKLPIALKRCFSESSHTARVSLDRAQLSTISSKEEAIERIKQRSSEEITKAISAMSETVLVQRISDEIEQIEVILENRDALSALRLLPGKQLAQKLAPLAGCKNSLDLMRSVKNNLATENYPIIHRISEDFQTALHPQKSDAEEPAEDQDQALE